MSKALVASLGLLMSTACGATQSAPTLERQAQVPKRHSYSEELEHAERLRLDAEGLKPPVPDKMEDQKASLAFLNTEVRAWVEQRRSAVERASTAYAELIPRLLDADMAEVALATGNMQLSFAEDVERVTVAAAPPSITKDATLLATYRNAIRDASRQQYSKARAAFENCIAAAERAGAPTLAATCRARLMRLPDDAASASPPSASTTRPTVAELPRPFVPVRQPSPCVFSGTLKLWRAPLSLAPEGRRIARFNHIEIEKLELPTKVGDPFRLSLTWPIRGTFSMAQETLPFDLRSRVDFIRNHIWLSAGSAVSAIRSDAGNATVLRPQPQDETLRSSPEPARVMSCKALELAGLRPTWNAAPSGQTLRFLGDVPLRAAPNGAPLGVLRLRSALVVRALERREGWTRIAVESTTVRSFGEITPYDFDAWTSAAPSDEEAFGMLGVFQPETAPTYVTTSEIDLYDEPGSQPFAKVVAGVAILAGETRGGFVEVSVPGLLPSDAKQWGFWVREQAFRTGTSDYRHESTTSETSNGTR